MAERMRQTLIEVLGEEKGRSLYSLDWLKARVLFHLDAAQSTAKVYIAEEPDGAISGHTIVRVDFDESGTQIGLFSTTFVAPEFRKRGTADRLLERGESWIAGIGLKRAFTYTSDSNEKLIRLYEKHGYRIGLRFEEKRMIRLEKDLSDEKQRR